MAKDLSTPISELTLTVRTHESGHRLDHFLIEHITWRSRTDLQARVRTGRVLRNGCRSKVSARLRAGDYVVLLVNSSDLPDQDPSSIEVNILYEDDVMIVVNKQAGLVVHPTGRHVYDTLMNALHWRCRKNGDLERGIMPHVVHRLDQDTSGVLVVAKTDAAKKVLQREFEDRHARKSYLALVAGQIPVDTMTINRPLRRAVNAEVRLKMETADDGLPSLSEVEVVERFAGVTLVRVAPKTGRQHQIRVHLAASGFPILADPLYGDPRDLGINGVPLLTRQALHAERLEFRHPVSSHTVCFDAPLASDMAALAAALRESRRLEPLEDRQSRKWRTA